ncbi:MAG TPA: RNA polymerase sigma factor [Bacteroidales bacterium]
MDEMSDQHLLDLLRKEETRRYGFDLLVRQYQQRIYRHVRHLVIHHDDTDDIVQNVFLKVWNNLATFREDAKLYTWIYRIATNEALSHLKSKRLRMFLSFNGMEKQMEQALHDDNYFSGDEIEIILHQAILKLPTKQRLVFNMRYYNELSYEEISAITGTSAGALKASYHFAAKKVEEYVTTH